MTISRWRYCVCKRGGGWIGVFGKEGRKEEGRKEGRKEGGKGGTELGGGGVPRFGKGDHGEFGTALCFRFLLLFFRGRPSDGRTE